MRDALIKIQSECRQWRDDAIEKGWLVDGAGAELDSALTGDPSQVFSAGERRPLVVAFFGGTGVGKSTLLNRLAGAKIANTGVIRPTSREVTVYAHESISLSQLPEKIPADKVRLTSHSHAVAERVVWIDTPDVDSVATEHREQVLAWLPYVDLVIYVVNPERYKDDVGWQMLREAGDQHAWLFVMNHWDRGQPEQLHDFKQVLSLAGFPEPRVFCTDCTEGDISDDFDTLQLAVEELSEHQSVQSLVAKAESAQVQRLVSTLCECVSRLGTEEALEKLLKELDAVFEKRQEQLDLDLAWQISNKSQLFQEQQLGWWQLLGGKSPPVPNLPSSELKMFVWDERASQQIKDTLADVAGLAGNLDLPVKPLRAQLYPVSERSTNVMEKVQGKAVSESIARPGKRLHRWLFNGVSAVASLAPVAALVWVGYRTLISFYSGNELDGQYVGSDFAINSLLLVVVAWLLPTILKEKVRPSVQASVARAMRQGLGAGVEELAAEARNGILLYKKERLNVVGDADHLVRSMPRAEIQDYLEHEVLRPTPSKTK